MKPAHTRPFQQRRKPNAARPAVVFELTRAGRQRQITIDAAAFDRMCAARPLRPPPMPIQPRVRTAGELALATDIRLGLYMSEVHYGR